MLIPEYIVGLVDGEGSFTVYIKDPKSNTARTRRVRAEPKFYIKLMERDRAILFEIQKYFGCGNIYLQKDKRPTHNDCYRYEVTKREDLRRTIIPFFEKYELRLVSKRKDFKLFCSLLSMIESGKHLRSAGLKQMYVIKQKMH